MDGYPYLNPCVNDNREEADREYVEEFEKIKQPHVYGGRWKRSSGSLEKVGIICVHVFFSNKIKNCLETLGGGYNHM